MGKQLLNAKFSALGGIPTVYIGAHSSNNVTATANTWYDSRYNELHQQGCQIYCPALNNSYSTNMDATSQSAIKDAMGVNNGYGDYCALPKNSLQYNVKMYINGKAVDDNNIPQPYIQWEINPYNSCPALYYYRGDGTSMGMLFNFVGYFGEGLYALCGQMYDDGTFTGEAIEVKPYIVSTSPLIYSTKRYQWRKPADQYSEYTDYQIIPTAIMDDLYEYLPFAPEGETDYPGNGDFDASSDSIGFPGLPSISALDTGMVAMYNLSITDLQSLSSYLWSPWYENLEKMFNDPMEAIMNLCIEPISLPASQLVSGVNIKIGNIVTTVTGTRVTNPYKIIDFGTINLNEYWGSFADYSPYTKLSIFLPYIGVQSMSIDDVMNGSIQLKAYCDTFTGSIQYVLLSHQGNHRQHGHNSVLYTWGGNMQYQIPVTASNFSQVISSLIGSAGTVAGALGATVASGGLSAPIAVGAVGGLVSNVMSAKTHIQRGGGLGGAVGLFGVQTPYLILERPEQIFPNNFEDINGVPNETTDYLANYSGYVKVREIHMSSTTATGTELTEIEKLLKEGVEV